MDAEAKAEIEKCRKEKVPALCFHRLKMRYGSVKATTRYCTRANLPGCEKFLYAPKEGGWTCFDDEAQCSGSLIATTEEEAQQDALKEAVAQDNKQLPLPTPCVWCKIPLTK